MFQGDDIEFLQEMHQLKEIKKIGEGSFGRVYKAIDLSDNSICAVKVISKTVFKDAEDESNIYQLLDNPHIVACKRITENKNHFFLIMELMEGGTLANLMAQKILNDDEAALVMKCILSAVHYLHDKRIIHRDLKPENIMLANDSLDSVKIADFGLSFKLSQDGAFFSLMNKKCGTILYMAPEQFQEKYYSKQVDSWSCGIILYMLLTGGHHPFYRKHESKEMVIKRITNAQWKFPAHFTPLAIDLIQKLTTTSPTDRYSIGQALIHPWITRNFQDKIPLTYNQQINQFLKEQQIRQQFKMLFFLQYLKLNSQKKSQQLQPDFVISECDLSRSEKKSNRNSQWLKQEQFEHTINVVTHKFDQKQINKYRKKRINSPKPDNYKIIDLAQYRRQQQGKKSYENLNSIERLEVTQTSFRSSQDKPKLLMRQQIRPQTIEQIPSSKILKQKKILNKQPIMTSGGLPPLKKK